MRTTGHLDYLAVTFPVGTSCENFTPITGTWIESGAGGHGYQRKRISESGATWEDAGTTAQGCHLEMKGQQLEYMRDDRSDDKELINNIAELRGKASRVDLTVNCFDAKMTVRSLWSLWIAGQGKSKAQTAREYFAPDGQGTDDGFYMGSRDSDRMLRVYNKGRQLGSVEAHVRLELQCRRLVAQASVKALKENDNVRTVINRAILDHTQIYDPEYLSALADNDATIDPIPRSQPAFWQWVERQLVPSFVKRQAAYPDENVMNEIGRIFDEQWGLTK